MLHNQFVKNRLTTLKDGVKHKAAGITPETLVQYILTYKPTGDYPINETEF